MRPRLPPPPRTPARRRQLLRMLSTVFLVSGAIVLTDVGVTLAWQEPMTAIVGRVRQDDLARDLDRLPIPGTSAGDRRVLAGLSSDGRRLAYLAGRFRAGLEIDDPTGRIAIPRFGADFVTVFGTDPDALTHGPGTYPDQPLPGQAGTTAIAGHRTTYLAPFRHIDELRPNDPVTVTMPYGRFVYRVDRVRRVTPRTISFLRDVGRDRLVLTACDPPFSAARRIVVIARLDEATLARAAR